MQVIATVAMVSFAVAATSFGLLAIEAVSEWTLPYFMTQTLAAGVVFGLLVGIFASTAARSR